MSKLKTLKGVIATFWQMTKEDWYYMDRKFLRIIFSVVGFAIAALFWLLFFRNISPF